MGRVCGSQSLAMTVKPCFFCKAGDDAAAGEEIEEGVAGLRMARGDSVGDEVEQLSLVADVGDQLIEDEIAGAGGRVERAFVAERAEQIARHGQTGVALAVGEAKIRDP